MKSTLKVENPGEVQMTLSITMPLADWKRLKDQVSEKRFSYPANYLSKTIREMTQKAEQEFEEKED